MPLSLHLFIHFSFSLLAGLIVWRIWKRPIASFFAGILGGFLVDLDHFIDYFIAFGFDFRLDYFIIGAQFMKNEKIYVLFHAWEYVVILILIIFLFKNKIIKSFLLALAIGLFFHLCTDVVIDKVPIKTYSIIYRIKNNFAIEKLSYPDRYERHLRNKKVFERSLK